MSADAQKAYDSLSPEQQAEHDRQERERERLEQEALPYKWTQDLGTVSINVPVPAGTKAKDLSIVIKKKQLKVQLKASSEPILSGEVFNDIKEEDSTWTLQDNVVSIELEKLSGRTANHQWWPHVLTHHPKIDTTKITPENSKLSDLDGETRAMVEKMMQMGKPTSDEMKKLEMIEKFKKSHPEMDFSNAKIA